MSIVAIGAANPGRLFAQELVKTRDHLVGRLLGAEAVGCDPIDRGRPDMLRAHPDVPPLPGDRTIVVAMRLGQGNVIQNVLG